MAQIPLGGLRITTEPRDHWVPQDCPPQTLTSAPSKGNTSPFSWLRLSLILARRRFSSSGFRVCGEVRESRWAQKLRLGGSRSPTPRCRESLSPVPTLRSSAASPTLLGSLMLPGKAKSAHGPVPRGGGSCCKSEQRTKRGTKFKAEPKLAPKKCAPSQLQAFKEAAPGSVPPRPTESGQRHSHLSAFVSAQGGAERKSQSCSPEMSLWPQSPICGGVPRRAGADSQGKKDGWGPALTPF